MMTRAGILLKQAGCPKVNLQIRGTYTSAIEFYRRLGYEVDVCEPVRLGRWYGLRWAEALGDGRRRA